MGVNESLHFLSMYFCLFWNAFGIGDVHENLLSNGQLCESWRSVSYTFFNETDEFLFVRGLLEKYPTFGREKETSLPGALDT